MFFSKKIKQDLCWHFRIKAPVVHLRILRVSSPKQKKTQHSAAAITYCCADRGARNNVLPFQMSTNIKKPPLREWKRVRPVHATLRHPTHTKSNCNTIVNSAISVIIWRALTSDRQLSSTTSSKTLENSIIKPKKTIY